MGKILEPGTKVKILGFGDRFPGTYTIKAFIDDMCGEGCCQGYDLEEIDEGVIFWPNNVEEIYKHEKIVQSTEEVRK